MKKFLSLAVLASATAFGAQSDGYIVKFKKTTNLTKSTFKTLTTKKMEKLNTAGTIYFIDDLKSLGLTKKTIAANPEVEYIEPNYIYNIVPVIEENKSYSFNSFRTDEILDPKFGQQWGLMNTGKNGGKLPGGGKGNPGGGTGWGGSSLSLEGENADLDAIEAWKVTKGSKDLVIAVIDTGIDYNHEDLKDQMWTNTAELNGTEGVDDDGNGLVDDIYGYDFANSDSDPMDDQSHGSHCAGIIAASHNTSGIRGIMGNVKLMALKFLTAKGSGTTKGAIQAIQYATEKGVDIMSNSWGGGGKSQALEDVIKEASDAGIIFVAAAGNSNANNDRKGHYPSNYKVENVISVGAMNSRGERASFSCYGKESVHVFAPGRNILSTIPNNKYKSYSGTSMATPYIAGVLGLLKTLEPEISPVQAKQKLIDTSVKTEKLSKFSISGGYVNAFNAIR
jgi:subtilisin family serine protease